jgi:hypothetical protein
MRKAKKKKIVHSFREKGTLFRYRSTHIRRDLAEKAARKAMLQMRWGSYRIKSSYTDGAHGVAFRLYIGGAK